MCDHIKKLIYDAYNNRNKEPSFKYMIKPNPLIYFEDENTKKLLLDMRRFEHIFKMKLETFMDLYVKGDIVVKKYNRLEIKSND